MVVLSLLLKMGIAVFPKKHFFRTVYDGGVGSQFSIFFCFKIIIFFIKELYQADGDTEKKT